MNPVEFYDRFADRYDRFYSGPAVEAEDRVWLARLRQLGTVVDTGEVVDVGCGTGALLDHIRDGSRYLGIDASMPMIDRACRKHPEAKFMVADLDRRINVGRTFDLAVCNFAFNYFTDPFTVFWNLERMVRPGGFLFMVLMRPKQVLMRSCSHRFDFSLTTFYPSCAFNKHPFSIRRVVRFGATVGVRSRFLESLIPWCPWLANFEVVVCERT